jgi:hypothetical protein
MASLPRLFFHFEKGGILTKLVNRDCAKLVINVTRYGYGCGSPAAGKTFDCLSVPAKRAAPKGGSLEHFLTLYSCAPHPSHRPRRCELSP